MTTALNNPPYEPPVFTEVVSQNGKKIDWTNKYESTGVEVRLEYRTDPNNQLAHIFVYRKDGQGVQDEQKAFEPTTEGTLAAFDYFNNLTNKEDEKQNPPPPPPPPPHGNPPPPPPPPPHGNPPPPPPPPPPRPPHGTPPPPPPPRPPDDKHNQPPTHKDTRGGGGTNNGNGGTSIGTI